MVASPEEPLLNSSFSVAVYKSKDGAADGHDKKGGEDNNQTANFVGSYS